jgi:glycosyltransferase involved in cell wall biosynthesis
MISIITGTLNRLSYLPNLIKNTVEGNNKVELILVDGGSTDGTIEYVENLKHPRIKLIKHGKRSNYPHFMNLAILHSTYDWVCQWNDDVLLLNDWDEVINEIKSGHDFYLFNWKYGKDMSDMSNSEWARGIENKDGWFICNTKDELGDAGEIVVNFGLYNKKIFEKIGMYDMKFKYYYTDGDMAQRAWYFGFKNKDLRHIKVFSYDIPKKAIHYSGDEAKYKNNIGAYKNKNIPHSVPYLIRGDEDKIVFKE